MPTIWYDLRHGLRAWSSQPSLYAIALTALALGIGANTTIFSAAIELSERYSAISARVL